MNHTLIVLAVLLVAGAALVGCSGFLSGGTAGNDAGFRQVTAQEAKELMDSEQDYVILDVRTEGEYAEGHVPGATLLPLNDVASKAESVLTDKDQLILVYCRSGNRSKQAAKTLASLGYTNVVDFGGISSWPYDIEK